MELSRWIEEQVPWGSDQPAHAVYLHLLEILGLSSDVL